MVANIFSLKIMVPAPNSAQPADITHNNNLLGVITTFMLISCVLTATLKRKLNHHLQALANNSVPFEIVQSGWAACGRGGVRCGPGYSEPLQWRLLSTLHCAMDPPQNKDNHCILQIGNCQTVIIMASCQAMSPTRCCGVWVHCAVYYAATVPV